VKATVRIPTHLSPVRNAPPESEDEGHFINRPCYVFNPSLPRSSDDARCRHCRHYLTAACPHIEEFLDDVEDLAPE
jgi:hypothetical protein